MAVKLAFEHNPRWLQGVTDSLIMVQRSTRHIVRNRDQLLGTFFQPIMFLVLFAAVFGGAVSQSLPPGVNYLAFLLPGIIVQTLAFGSTTTAIAITNDLSKGIIDRFRSLPMSKYLRAFAENQPFTQIVDSARALMLGLPIGNHGWLAVMWCVAILIVSLPLAAYLFRRKTAQ
jgi:ABC-type polysaccharide/polyol phosphate export permease